MHSSRRKPLRWLGRSDMDMEQHCIQLERKQTKNQHVTRSVHVGRVLKGDGAGEGSPRPGVSHLSVGGAGEGPARAEFRSWLDGLDEAARPVRDVVP
jgi:hypothetical protein